MIWLSDKNTISKNQFVSKDESLTNNLLFELKKVKESDLVGSEIIITDKRVCDGYENDIFIKYFDTNISRCQYLLKKYRCRYPVSKFILESLETNQEIDLGKMIDVFSYDFSILKKISNYADSSIKSYLTQKISEDYYFFIFKLLDVLRLEKIRDYDIDKIKHIKEMSSDIIETNCDYYLDKTIVASNNSKVLNLAFKLRK